MQPNAKKRVGIIRGGTGEYYASSLKRGGDVILHIHENLSDKYQPVDILIDKDYVWHVNGLPINPGDLVHKIDIAWNFSHPSFSHILESLSIPHVKASSLLENNSEMLRDHMKQIGVSMPRSIVLPVYQQDFDADVSLRETRLDSRQARQEYAIKKAKEIHAKFAAPWIVKSALTDASRGRSFTPDKNMGIHLAKTFPELVHAIEDGVTHEKSILVEEFIMGKVAGVHSVPGFRGEDIYVFPPDNVFGLFSSAEKEQLVNLARDIHRHIGALHYLKSNFVMNNRGKAYLSQIESVPNVQPGSHFHQVCESVGAKIHHIVEHMLEKTLL